MYFQGENIILILMREYKFRGPDRFPFFVFLINFEYSIYPVLFLTLLHWDFSPVFLVCIARMAHNA